MAQLDTLLLNIDVLTDTIIDIGEKINKLSAIKAPTFTFSDADGNGTFKMLTNRQMAKKIIMMGGNITGVSPTQGINAGVNTLGQRGAAVVNIAAGGLINQIDEDIAHLTVYGKFLYDSNGILIDNEILYPECVAVDGEGEGGVNHMTSSNPLLQRVKDIKKEFKFAVAGLRIKAGEIGQAFIDMIFQLVLAITTLASAATILPPGSGLPTALSAIKSIPTTLMAFQTRIVQIVPLLAPLSYIGLILPTNKLDSALAPINIVLTLLRRPFEVIDVVLGLVTAMVSATPPVPGVDGEPAEPIEIKPNADPSTINQGGVTPVKLTANASKGSWEYKYLWTSSQPGFSSTEKEVVVTPSITTTYYIKVTDTKDDTNIAKGEILVTVAQ